MFRPVSDTMPVDKNDLVRGRKRQRRKAPKTRTGCMTCKIRRIKCDEQRPRCNRCTSTGRKCDGYIESEPKAKKPPAHDAGLVSASQPYESITAANAEGGRALIAELGDNMYFPIQLYERSNPEPEFPLLPTGFASPHLPGRAFHYFIHRSSGDLTGPYHSQVWREYILSVCATSPTIQNAVVALSSFHERFTFPANAVSDEQCWRQYYIAVKSTSALVQAASRGDTRRRNGRPLSDEILVACAIFVTIEILLGNTDAALQHIEGGLSLIQAFLTKDRTPIPPPLCFKNHTSSLDIPSTSEAPCPYFSQLDAQVADLIGFFARLDLQILAFLPRRHHSTQKPSAPPRYATLQISQPLPNAPSANLYRVMKHAMYWIRHYASAFKYCPDVPEELYQAQEDLLTALHTWKVTFCNSNNEVGNPILGPDTMCPEDANLLLAYHLTFLKLFTALSPSERIFNTTPCMGSFRTILINTFTILRLRNARMAPVCLPADTPQSEFFFSLETSLVEPLYYMALKCRHQILRRCAVSLLKCAGREGVWDGLAMARVAEHVIAMEEGRFESSSLSPNPLSVPDEKFLQTWPIRSRGKDKPEALHACVSVTQGLARLMTEGGGEWEEVIKEERLVHDVVVDVDRELSTVDVECGWFVESERTWRHQRTALGW